MTLTILADHDEECVLELLKALEHKNIIELSDNPRLGLKGTRLSIDKLNYAVTEAENTLSFDFESAKKYLLR